MVELNRGNESLPVRCLFFFFFHCTVYRVRWKCTLAFGNWCVEVENENKNDKVFKISASTYSFLETLKIESSKNVTFAWHFIYITFLSLSVLAVCHPPFHLPFQQTWRLSGSCCGPLSARLLQ